MPRRRLTVDITIDGTFGGSHGLFGDRQVCLYVREVAPPVATSQYVDRELTEERGEDTALRCALVAGFEDLVRELIEREVI